MLDFRLLILRKKIFLTGSIFYLWFFSGFNHFSYSQYVMDPEELSHAKTFYSIESAMQQPDSIFRLDLSRKKLKSFPAELFLFKNLQWLNLCRNQIALIPDSISIFKSLQELDLSKNNLSQIPSAIGALKHLTVLKLNRNKITSLPEETGNLINLEVLELWDNELDTVPDEVRNLKSLKKLELRGILFSDAQQQRIVSLLPNTKILFSPSCACKE